MMCCAVRLKQAVVVLCQDGYARCRGVHLSSHAVHIVYSSTPAWPDIHTHCSLESLYLCLARDTVNIKAFIVMLGTQSNDITADILVTSHHWPLALRTQNICTYTMNWNPKYLKRTCVCKI